MVKHFHNVKFSEKFGNIVLFHKSFSDNFCNTYLICKLRSYFSNNSKASSTNNIFDNVVVLEKIFLFHFNESVPFDFNVFNAFIDSNGLQKIIMFGFIFRLICKRVGRNDSLNFFFMVVNRTNVIEYSSIR